MPHVAPSGPPRAFAADGGKTDFRAKNSESRKGGRVSALAWSGARRAKREKSRLHGDLTGLRLLVSESRLGISLNRHIFEPFGAR